MGCAAGRTTSHYSTRSSWQTFKKKEKKGVKGGQLEQRSQKWGGLLLSILLTNLLFFSSILDVASVPVYRP
jgi:hypothetical protein